MFPDGLLPPGWELAGQFGLLVAVIAILRRAPWRSLLDARRSNHWLGTVVLVSIVWLLKAGVQPGLHFHLIGAMALTLMFGPWLAVLALLLVVVITTAQSGVGWTALGLNALFYAVIPVGTGWAWFSWADRRLPNHFFVFIFVVAFAGGAGTMLVMGLATTAALALAGAYSPEHLLANFLPYHLLLAFAEAWLTGMVTTLFVVYKPTWVTTFDDKRYLLNK